MTSTATMIDDIRSRAQTLRLYGLLAYLDQWAEQPWVLPLIKAEEEARAERSLQRRIKEARVGSFKPMADFDWKWPKHIDRAQVDEVSTLSFIEAKTNVIFLGPNGVGKTMIARNMAHLAVLRGYTVRMCSAGELLAELGEQESIRSLNRRLRRYTRPDLLVIDELGYLSYDDRAADLLFEVINRRYEKCPTVITTNKPFSEWNEVFPNASCVVTLIDRLVHHSEIISIEGESYRLKEAREQSAARAAQRKGRQQSKKTSS